VAVTTVAGNQTLEKVTANAIRVLDVAGATSIPVAAGADRPLVHPARVAAEVHGETGLDGPELSPPSREPEPVHAVELMARMLRERPLTLVPIGPLTNIALLLALHPELAPRIERIVLMGGAIAEGNVTPAAEFNIWCDAEAAQRVFSSGLDVTMVGLDVTHRARLGPDRAEGLRASGRAGAFVADLHAFYSRFHAQIYGDPSTPVHDALAVASLIRPALLHLERLHAEVDTSLGLCRGRTVVDRWRRTGLEPNAGVAIGVNGDAFIDLLCARIASLG
jgi:inosine-uridine nucleoside N-ribohydrolase